MTGKWVRGKIFICLMSWQGIGIHRQSVYRMFYVAEQQGQRFAGSQACRLY